jgi:uncharacterized protein (DUF362 family)
MNFNVYTGSYKFEHNIKDILTTHFSHQLRKIKENNLVLMKPNMFMDKELYYTNPRLLKILCQIFKEFGAKVVIAERLKAIYSILKHDPEIAKLCEIKSFDDLPTMRMKIVEATSLRQEIDIPSILLECDFLVGVPQFRTHIGVLMSNALKNMVGILPNYSTRIVHNVGLTEAIIDLNRIRKQDLVIADLTTTIEGNYPIKGIPMHRNLIIVGDNALAVDLVAADVSGIAIEDINYLKLASKAALGPESLNQINFLSDNTSLKFNCIPSYVPIENRNKNRSICSESACPECTRFCDSLLNLLNEDTTWQEDILITSGCNLTEQTFNMSTHNTVLIGNCTYAHRNKGIFVEGCPPRAIQLVAAAEWLKNNGNVIERHKNQCRWPQI